MELLFFILFLLFVFYVIVWIKQFLFVIRLDDKSLPGQYDKPLWIAVFIFLLPIAPILFICFKWTYPPFIEEENKRAEIEKALDEKDWLDKYQK